MAAFYTILLFISPESRVLASCWLMRKSKQKHVLMHVGKKGDFWRNYFLHFDHENSFNSGRLLFHKKIAENIRILRISQKTGHFSRFCSCSICPARGENVNKNSKDTSQHKQNSIRKGISRPAGLLDFQQFNICLQMETALDVKKM